MDQAIEFFFNTFLRESTIKTLFLRDFLKVVCFLRDQTDEHLFLKNIILLHVFHKNCDFTKNFTEKKPRFFEAQNSLTVDQYLHNTISI